MDLETEIQNLHGRKQRLEVKREGLVATLETKRATRDKLLAKLKEKGIDPNALPQMIADLEASLAAQVKTVQQQFDAAETALSAIEAALQTQEAE